MLPDTIPLPIPGGLEPPLPDFIRVRQGYSTSAISDLDAAVEQGFADISDIDLSGASVAIAVGSRGIKRQFEMVSRLIRGLKARGAEPFVFPAMGSHGGGTAEGQTELLASLGFSEAALGVPVRASMDVVEIGRIENGPPVYCDAIAAGADWIVPVNRVKPHTAYRARHESGLAKMLAIGISKHAGAEAMHFYGFEEFGRLIPAAARIFLEAKPVLFGVGIVENAVKDILALEFPRPGEFLDRDAQLLELARSAMPRLLFGRIDVLIVDEMGKNISGSGMDPNVTGRPSSGLPGFEAGISIGKVVIRDLTEASHGNACGMGTADVTTMRLARKVDWTKTYVNNVTAGLAAGAKFPIVANSDREAIAIALRCSAGVAPGTARIVRIRNTLELADAWASLPMTDDIASSDGLVAMGAPFPMCFDAFGNIAGAFP